MAQALLVGINADRSAHGLGTLSWDGSLASLADKWSAHMAGVHDLAHQSPSAEMQALSLTGFGENVSQGMASTTATQVHAMWMQSDVHRMNILQPGFDHVGIGVFCAADGTMWATEDFGRTQAAASHALSSAIPPATPSVWGGNSSHC
jgi:uncharacterized protein YkwD